MNVRAANVWALWGLAFGSVVATSIAAQEDRLSGRLSADAMVLLVPILDSARAEGLPTGPLADRALEGSVKGASAALIASAVRRLWIELRAARGAFGNRATPAELYAGASALRAGAMPRDLEALRERRPGRPLIIPSSVLAELVAVGVPSDSAVAAVLVMAAQSQDAEYIAFRRDVERDIALGASPAAALGVRLRAVKDAAAAQPGLEMAAPGSGTRRRKP
jgi:hypothetical protein